MSESIPKSSAPKAADKSVAPPTLTGGMVNPTTLVAQQPQDVSDDLPLTMTGEASQAEAQSVEEALVPQDTATVEPTAGPAKNTRAKANPTAKPKRAAKKQAEPVDKQPVPRAPRLPTNNHVKDPEPDIMELLGDKDCQPTADPLAPIIETPPAEKNPPSDNREAI
ncbi:hypothetical protein PTTG_30910, partial [Puccinia triticina 1-1 BBBD Race 1]